MKKRKEKKDKPSARTNGIGKGKGQVVEKNPMTESQERTQQTNNQGKYGEAEYLGNKKPDEERLNELKL
jgi:hypothetical protein